jgi:hypothetical protein
MISRGSFVARVLGAFVLTSITSVVGCSAESAGEKEGSTEGVDIPTPPVPPVSGKSADEGGAGTLGTKVVAVDNCFGWRDNGGYTAFYRCIMTDGSVCTTNNEYMPGGWSGWSNWDCR